MQANFLDPMWRTVIIQKSVLPGTWKFSAFVVGVTGFRGIVDLP